LLHCCGDKICLCRWRPDCVTRAVGVPKSGSIKSNDAVLLRRSINQAAGLEVLNHTAIAVQQDERSSSTAFHVMKLNAVHCNEASNRWVVTLRSFHEPPGSKGRRRSQSLQLQLRSAGRCGPWRKCLVHETSWRQNAKEDPPSVHDLPSGGDGCCTAGQRTARVIVPSDARRGCQFPRRSPEHHRRREFPIATLRFKSFPIPAVKPLPTRPKMSRAVARRAFAPPAQAPTAPRRAMKTENPALAGLPI